MFIDRAKSGVLQPVTFGDQSKVWSTVLVLSPDRMPIGSSNFSDGVFLVGRQAGHFSISNLSVARDEKLLPFICINQICMADQPEDH